MIPTQAGDQSSLRKMLLPWAHGGIVRRDFPGCAGLTGEENQPATMLNDLSMARNTRSSSWPRRTIRPVAEITQ